MIKTINIILAISLLLCLAPMPYGYYQFVKFAAMCVFGWMSYKYYQAERENLMIVFGALALLFQPFFKVALGRTLWNVVDVIVAIGLIVIICIRSKEH